jgi:hypothetical protein
MFSGIINIKSSNVHVQHGQTSYKTGEIAIQHTLETTTVKNYQCIE